MACQLVIFEAGASLAIEIVEAALVLTSITLITLSSQLLDGPAAACSCFQAFAVDASISPPADKISGWK